MASTLASEPLLRELFLSPTVTAKRPPSPDRAEVGGVTPCAFCASSSPGPAVWILLGGLDVPCRREGRGDAALTRRALPPRCLLLGRRFSALCRRRRAPGGPGRPGARAVPPCCRRGRGGASPLRRPRPAGAAPSGRRERSRGTPGLPGSHGSRSGRAFRGRCTRPGRRCVARCSSHLPLPDSYFILFIYVFFSLISVQFVAFHFSRYHSELTSSDLSDALDIKNVIPHPPQNTHVSDQLKRHK